MGTKKRAVVLLSGGLDSATTMAIARNMDFDCFAMTFRYGQRHEVEIAASRAVAKSLGAVEGWLSRGHRGSVGGARGAPPAGPG